MPRGDRTGPWGQGPMTGRRMGYCAGFSDPGFATRGPGLGYGQGFGLGRGLGRRLGPFMGRGWRRPGFGRFRRYPSARPPVYDYGMPNASFPSYGYPYGRGYGTEYSQQAPGRPKQKKQNKEAK